MTAISPRAEPPVSLRATGGLRRRQHTERIAKTVLGVAALLSVVTTVLIILALFFGYRFISDANSRNAPKDQPDAAALENADLFKNIGKAGYVDLSGNFPSPGDLKDFISRYDDENAAQKARMP